jgi:hypothetical protein
LTLPRIAALMMSGMCASVQAELDGLFGQIEGSSVRIRGVSAQAFSQMRRGLSANVFEALNARLLDLAGDYVDAWRWHGLRVVAADGSRLTVATRKGAQLRSEHYAFALFLPGAELTLHASLHPADGSERQMLFESLDQLQPLTDLTVIDRGFPGATMLAAMSQAQRHFCVRVDATGWKCVRAFVRSNLAETVVDLAAPSAIDAPLYELQRTPTRVRLIRDVTPSGSIRVLMTSLLDSQRYPAADFGALYHQRWRIEEAFKRIKHRLRLEAATGLTTLAFQQDFAAKIVADNLHVLLAAADEQAAAPTDRNDACVAGAGDAAAKAAQSTATRPNRTYALGALKPILAGCLLRVKECLRALPTALRAMARMRCRIQPHRSYTRPPRRKPHAYTAYRFNC